MRDKPRSLLAILKDLFRRQRPVVSPVAQGAFALASAPRSIDADWADPPYRPSREEIEVEEVDSAEFVQEWGRTVASQTEREPEVDPTHPDFVDRRLPNFDRRLHNFDRRDPTHNRRNPCSPALSLKSGPGLGER